VFVRKNGAQKRSVLAVRGVSSTGFDEKNTKLILYANRFLKREIEAGRGCSRQQSSQL
jgi:hypothetical protein